MEDSYMEDNPRVHRKKQADESAVYSEQFPKGNWMRLELVPNHHRDDKEPVFTSLLSPLPVKEATRHWCSEVGQACPQASLGSGIGQRSQGTMGTRDDPGADP